MMLQHRPNLCRSASTARMSWITAVHNAIAAVIAASSSSVVLSRRAQIRRRVRTELRFRPGPGFAFLFELVFRWGRLAALHRGRCSRLGSGHFARVFRVDECVLDLCRVAPILDTANLHEVGSEGPGCCPRRACPASASR
jgi:hypothetical protein